jgi:U2 small nuclear ribonucleoprotein B''
VTLNESDKPSKLRTMAPMNYAELNGCTVYVQRIFPERLNSQNQVDKLTETIRACFEDYGTILDIIVKRSLRRKGQAFVVFDNSESAATAQEELDGFELAPDSPITTSIAKTPSDATVEKFCSPEEFKEHKEKRLAEKGMCL